MSKERARRRAEREAVAERERAARRRVVRRRERRRALLRRLTPAWPFGRTGRLYARRSPRQRAAIAASVVVAIGAIWYLVPDPALRLLLTLLLLLGLPVIIVITLDRRI
ncbi:hypothetical protein [Melissospora conviva]|uniref:hypothetical protein n=1 Tax=Melissospora conviva TaxID=3388432 RepID=UPI003C1A9DA5